MKYLAVKNWAKYQSYLGGGKWIKDYTSQTDDEDLAKLSLFQRMVLQGIRRLVGKLGKNAPNDAHYICNSMNALRTDRPRVQNAIDTLIEQQWLIVMESPQLLDGCEEIKKENKNKKELKPSPRVARSDQRFQPCVAILDRYHKKFVGEKLAFSVWFGRRGGHQLKHLLKAEPGLTVGIFETSVATRARSPSVDHSQPVYEWIAHVLTKPRGANGQGISKADQREKRLIEQAQRFAERGDSTFLPALSSGDGGSGTSGLAGNAQDVRPGRSAGGHEPPHAQSAKAGSS